MAGPGCLGILGTLWVLGANGFGRLRYESIPRWLDPVSVYGANGQWITRPSPSVRLPGASVLVLANVWKRGVAMADDGTGVRGRRGARPR